MEALISIVKDINAVVWGPLMLVIILGAGLFLQAGLKLVPIRKLDKGFMSPSLLLGLLDEPNGLAMRCLNAAKEGLGPKVREKLVAVIQPEEGASRDGERVIAALRTRLAGFKVPARFIRTDALPRNAMGKIQRHRLAEFDQRVAT